MQKKVAFFTPVFINHKLPGLRLLVLFSTTCMLLFCAVAHAQNRSSVDRRVALVIGNATYKNSPLKNPVNDSRAVAAELRRLNFEVIERENVTREGFATAARDFGDRLKGATVGLFYFAGHGLQVRGKNFLVPIDADIAREDEVPYRSLDVNEILDKMDSARTPINLVLLDACRNNPFARSFKLSQVGLAQMDAPSGTLIAFATSPGSVAQDGEGSNGLYTGALLKHIGTDSLPIEQMLKRVRVDVVAASKSSQVPWESSSLNRDFAFAESRPSLAAAPAQTSAAPNVSLAAAQFALELAFWDAIKNSSSPLDYAAYLEQYPRGQFAALARVRSGNLTTVSQPQAAANVASAASAGSTPAAAQSGRRLTARTAFKSVSGRFIEGFSDGSIQWPSTAAGRDNPAVVLLPSRGSVQALASSPEGVYIAAVSNGQLFFVDTQQAVMIRNYDLIAAAGFVADSLTFSPDGRWLAVGGNRNGKSTQLVVAISTGKVLWDKPGSAVEFDSAQALVSLRQGNAGGPVEQLKLR